MGKNIRPYEDAVRDAEAYFRANLASGRANAGTVAIARRAWEIMAAQLRESPDSVLAYDRLPPDPRFGFSGPQRWQLDMSQRAFNELFPHLVSDEAMNAYVRKQMEYHDLGLQIVRSTTHLLAG